MGVDKTISEFDAMHVVAMLCQQPFCKWDTEHDDCSDVSNLGDWD